MIFYLSLNNYLKKKIMKKQLFTILSIATVSVATAQTPSPSFPTLQNTSYSMAPSANCKFLDVVSSTVVWGVGRSGVAVSQNHNDFTRTINGGTSFNTGKIYSDTTTYVIANLEGIDANTAWVSAYLKGPQAQGAIHRTTNGGANWINMTASNMYTNAASFANIITFVTPSIGITMGDPHSGNANEFEIWRTVDAGVNWTLISGANIPNPTAGEYGLVDVYCKQGTSNIWYGTNKGRIFRTTDAGLTWNAAVLPGSPTASLNVQGIAFTTPLNGMATVFNTATTLLEEYTTNNGGVSWTQLGSIDPNFGRNDFCAIPGTNVFASCANTPTVTNSGLSYSTDGGVTWTLWGSNAIGYLTIDFADPTSGWVSTFQTATVGLTGGIYKYTGPSLAGSVAPTAAFFAPPTLCLSGPSATAALTNVSTGSATPNYTWTCSPAAVFSSSTATSPTITFNGANTYTVTLLAANITGTNSTTQVVNVINCSSPSAAFSIPTTTLCNKVAVSFTNTTTGNPTPTYSWSTSPATNVTISPNSTATSPSITFSTAGVYSVTLLASNLGGTNQVTQVVTIANCAAISNFNIPALGQACGTLTPLTPTNTSTGNGTLTYTWSVVPNTGITFSPNSAAANPNINFTTAGIYTVNLIANNISGNTVSSQTVNIGICSGIANNSLLANNVSLYPNPTKDVVTLILPNNGVAYNVSITDILGSVIYTEKFEKNSNALQINLANKAKGVYFITIEGNKEKTTKKIIVE